MFITVLGEEVVMLLLQSLQSMSSLLLKLLRFELMLLKFLSINSCNAQA